MWIQILCGKHYARTAMRYARLYQPHREATVKKIGSNLGERAVSRAEGACTIVKCIPMEFMKKIHMLIDYLLIVLALKLASVAQKCIF